MLTFRRGTKLILVDGINRYSFLVSDASASQTFLETSHKQKTIQDPVLVDNTFVTEKSLTTVTFGCYVTPEVEAIFRWFDFRVSLDKFFFPLRNIALHQWDIYIQSGSTIYKVDSCVGENISFVLGKRAPISLNITAMGRDLVEVPSIPAIGNLVEQPYSSIYGDYLLVNDDGKVLGTTCELTRSITWLHQKSLHSVLSGELYIPTTPFIQNYSISGSITTVKRDSDKEYADDTPVKINYGESFEINLTNCNITDRWNISSALHQKTSDYKMLPNETSFITI